MRDHALRRLERAWIQDGEPGQWAAVLRARLRSGQVGVDVLYMAAVLGDEGACLALDVPSRRLTPVALAREVLKWPEPAGLAFLAGVLARIRPLAKDALVREALEAAAGLAREAAQAQGRGVTAGRRYQPRVYGAAGAGSRRGEREEAAGLFADAVGLTLAGDHEATRSLEYWIGHSVGLVQAFVARRGVAEVLEEAFGSGLVGVAETPAAARLRARWRAVAGTGLSSVKLARAVAEWGEESLQVVGCALVRAAGPPLETEGEGGLRRRVLDAMASVREDPTPARRRHAREIARLCRRARAEAGEETVTALGRCTCVSQRDRSLEVAEACARIAGASSSAAAERHLTTLLRAARDDAHTTGDAVRAVLRPTPPELLGEPQQASRGPEGASGERWPLRRTGRGWG